MKAFIRGRSLDCRAVQGWARQDKAGQTKRVAQTEIISRLFARPELPAGHLNGIIMIITAIIYSGFHWCFCCSLVKRPLQGFGFLGTAKLIGLLQNNEIRLIKRNSL